MRRTRSLAAVLVLAAFLVMPDVVPAESAAPRGSANWVCLAYGALAGFALMSGSVAGAAGLALGAARAGCFG